MYLLINCISSLEACLIRIFVISKKILWLPMSRSSLFFPLEIFQILYLNLYSISGCVRVCVCDCVSFVRLQTSVTWHHVTMMTSSSPQFLHLQNDVTFLISAPASLTDSGSPWVSPWFSVLALVFTSNVLKSLLPSSVQEAHFQH